MQKLEWRSIAGLVVVVVAGTSGTTAFALTGQQYASQATVTLEQARAKALKAVPGKITDQELEKEAGGSGLRYSFDVAHQGKTYEVGIDAKTGAVRERSIAGPNSD